MQDQSPPPAWAIPREQQAEARFEALQDKLLRNPWANPPADYEPLLVYGLVPELPFFNRGVQIPFGDPGIGKSCLLAHVAAQASACDAWILWLDADGDESNLLRRFVANGGHPSQLEMLDLPADLRPTTVRAWQNELEEMVKLRDGPTMVVIDSLPGLLADDGAASVSHVLRGFAGTAKHAGVFVNDHASKTIAEGAPRWKRCSGSVQKAASARLMLEVERGTATVVKSNIDDAPVGMRLEWSLVDQPDVAHGAGDAFPRHQLVGKRIPRADNTEAGALRVLVGNAALLAQANARTRPQAEFTAQLNAVVGQLQAQTGAAARWDAVRAAMGTPASEFPEKLAAAGYQKFRHEGHDYVRVSV